MDATNFILGLSRVTAVQLAKLSGFSTIIATGRRYNTYHFKSLGVSTFVDRKASNFQEELIKAINGAKVDVVFDAVSLDDTQSLGWDILAPGGALILTQAPTIDREKYPDKKVVDDICGNVYNPHLRHLAVSMYKALPGLLESGKLKVSKFSRNHDECFRHYTYHYYYQAHRT